MNYYSHKGLDYTKKVWICQSIYISNAILQTYKEVKETVSDPEWQKKMKEEAKQAKMRIEKSFEETKKQVKEQGLLTYVKLESKKAYTFTKKVSYSAWWLWSHFNIRN